MRKVIQIAARENALYALCDDSTVWFATPSQVWSQCDVIPQDEPAESPVLAEREACAKIADALRGYSSQTEDPWDAGWQRACEEVAKEIRLRSNLAKSPEKSPLPPPPWEKQQTQSDGYNGA